MALPTLHDPARPGRRIVIVDDDPDLVLGLRVLLCRAGHGVEHARDGREGLRLVYRTRPDLVILDLGLPVMDGWQLLGRLRDLSDVPVLLLSAHGHERDTVRGLDAGADDYLTKPFANAELLARVTALLRRSAPPDWSAEVYDDGRLRIDPVRRAVVADGIAAQLAPIEFRLLNELVRHGGAVLSPAQLLARVWDDPNGVGPERVKFAVRRLRRRLGWAEPASSPVQSVRGIGYRYAAANRGPAAVL